MSLRTIFFSYANAFVPSLIFLLILWALLEPRFSRRFTRGAALGFLAVELVVQAALIVPGNELELAATFLPLTLYLPAILCLHLLSGNGFFPTALTWMLALQCGQILSALRKLLIAFTGNIHGSAKDWTCTVLLLLAAGLLLLLAYRFLRSPFRAYAKEQAGGWPPLLFLPAMLLTLYSYFLSSTTDVTVILLLFFTALSAFLVLSKLIVSLAEERRVRESRQQMEALRRDYELLQRKLELGRSYRHDMRHHIAALLALLQQGDTEHAHQYVAQWQGQLAETAAETWCRNAAVNAVLSAYLAQAREAGCTLGVNISLPEQLFFEETDLCVLLANALENAIHACKEMPEGSPRYIRLSAVLTDNRRLVVNVENSCLQDLSFDGKGFPIVPRRAGHGQGLKSIAAVAEKYHGMFRCSCGEGAFTLRAVLLDSTAAQARHSSRIKSALMIVFLACFLLNCMPTLALALETVPVLGQAVRIVNLRTYSWNWGSSGVSVQVPVLDGDPSAAGALEEKTEELIRQMQEHFREYASRKYQGYTAEDAAYEVIRDDDTLLALCFRITINAGGSVDYNRYLTLDRQAGQVLELEDLFQPGSNYIFPISREIRAQMEEQSNAGGADYFLPGGIWSDEECFKSIAPDQNFYINDENQLVIVFDEYEVAPGSMGTPEFVIPADCLDGLLAQPSILK